MVPWTPCRSRRALLPNWRKQPGLIHLVFTTKRGLTPAVRALIDHLVIGFKEDDEMDSPSAVRAQVSAKVAGRSRACKLPRPTSDALAGGLLPPTRATRRQSDFDLAML